MTEPKKIAVGIWRTNPDGRKQLETFLPFGGRVSTIKPRNPESVEGTKEWMRQFCAIQVGKPVPTPEKPWETMVFPAQFGADLDIAHDATEEEAAARHTEMVEKWSNYIEPTQARGEA